MGRKQEAEEVDSPNHTARGNGEPGQVWNNPPNREPPTNDSEN